MAVRSFEALGFDPAPGDVALTGDAARTLRTAVDAMSEVEGILAGERDGEWVGKSAEAFRASVADELTPRVQQALSSFNEATNAVQQWMGQLESFQDRAWRLEQRARQAQDDARAAQASLDAVPDAGNLPQRQADEAQLDRGRAQGRVDNANGALEAILREATSLRDEAEAAAGHTRSRPSVARAAGATSPWGLQAWRPGGRSARSRASSWRCGATPSRSGSTALVLPFREGGRCLALPPRRFGSTRTCTT